MQKSVVITGIGVITSLGQDVSNFWHNCLTSKVVIEPIPKQWQFYAKYHSGIWSPLGDIDFKTKGFSDAELLQRDPVSLLAMDAAQQALADAGFVCTLVNAKKNQYRIEGVHPDRVGVFIGTGIGGAKTFLENHAHQMLSSYKNIYTPENGATLLPCPPRTNPFVVSMLMPNSVSASIGIKYSLTGVNRTVTQACASGSSAIGSAFRMIKNGNADYALCGGAEYLYDDYGGIYRGFDIARTLAKPHQDITKSNRPFDEESNGFLYSQGGAAVLLLETRESARQRGAKIYAEITGFGETFDAYSMMGIDQENTQIPQAIWQALNEAKISPAEISYINTHGTGTKMNDTVEANIIRNTYSDNAIINASKSLLGHTIGASGAIEAAICALSIRDQVVHACHNLENPILNLNFAKSTSLWPINHAISHSFAFGGHNAALIFKPSS